MWWLLVANIAANIAVQGEKPFIDINGNVVFNGEVYRALVFEFGEPTQQTAVIEKRLLTFLQRAGYELARVNVFCRSNRLLVEVDEGRLEKIVFRRASTLKTIQLKLMLDMPHNVFNRPHLEKQLEHARRVLGLADISYQLVEVPQFVDHFGLQIRTFHPLPGFELLKAPRPRELHILIKRHPWSEGAKLRLRYNGLDGLVMGLSYNSGEVLLWHDRLGFDVAGGLRSDRQVGEEGRKTEFSLATTAVRWYTPPFLGLRPSIGVQGGLLRRQRLDLGIEHYDSLVGEATLGINYALCTGCQLALGGGEMYRKLFRGRGPGIEDDGVVVDVTQRRPFGWIKLSIDWDPDLLRRDKRHLLELSNRMYWWRNKDLIQSRVGYQKVFLLAWHELWLRAWGVWMWGTTLLADDEPVGGRHVRGIFSGEIFSRRVVSASTEFRFSLARDVYKASIYADVAAYDGLADGDGDRFRDVLWVETFGAGFHALAWDAFQVDVYYGWGRDSQLGWDRRISLRATHAY